MKMPTPSMPKTVKTVVDAQKPIKTSTTPKVTRTPVAIKTGGVKAPAMPKAVPVIKSSAGGLI